MKKSVVFYLHLSYNYIRTTGDRGKPRSPLGGEVSKSFYRDMWFVLTVVRSLLEHTRILCLAMRPCSPSLYVCSKAMDAFKEHNATFWSTSLHEVS